MPYNGQSANVAANRVTLKGDQLFTNVPNDFTTTPQLYSAYVPALRAVNDCVLVQQGTNPQQEVSIVPQSQPHQLPISIDMHTLFFYKRLYSHLRPQQAEGAMA